MGKVLGIDQGITSIGWGIIDTDSNEIIDAGVRLFSEADKKNNEGRRSFRSGRRLKRRRSTRKKDLVKLLNKNDLYSDNYGNLNPYECRKKGLSEVLTKDELNCALFNICKHRGSSLNVVEEENANDNESSTKYQLSENDKIVKQGKYVCEIQLERLHENGKFRGITNNFRSSDYEKELRKILSNQSISEELAEEIVTVIFRRRDFSEGPGSFISQTPYGRIYNDDGTVKVGMIEKMTGYCTIFPDELRAPKLSPSAEKYNLLNDLNNLSINGEKIDIDVKQELADLAFEKGSITPKKIADILQCNIADIKGFRENKNHDAIITNLEGFKIFKKIFEEFDNSELLVDIELLDKIAVILTKTKVYEERVNELKKILDNDELVEKLAIQTKFKNYHSLSLKALNIMNDELYNTQMNQMQILHASNKFEFNNLQGSQKGKKKISINDEAILSPVALRSYRQAIKVINAARREYGEFDSIVIETTRDKNSKEQKDRISELQKRNEKNNKLALERVSAYPGVKLNGKLREKLVLYEEQEAKTGYTQEPINIDLLITDPTAYEVDHIIPVSVSLDDSLNNKTLVSRKENQEKGQLTPFMAFSAGKISNADMERYKGFVKSLFSSRKISHKKYNNYMYEKDINRYENMKEFVARNLVDTSYANRLLLNTLQSYFRDNNIDTKVHTVKGFATNRFRKYLDIEKDRDKDYSHHAIDALLVASIKKMSLYRNLFKDFSLDRNYDLVFNRETGEIIDSIKDEVANQEDVKFIKAISNYKVSKFSHMIDTKPNRSVSDQTIYSTRNYGDGDVVIKKCKDIYEAKGKTVIGFANDVLNGREGKWLIARNDKQSFEKLKGIISYYYEQNKNDPELVTEGKKGIEVKFNPFFKHLSETGEYMTKYSKKGNGPVITSLKYIDGKLGSYIDISRNYKTKDKKIVLQQISPYRTDFYLDKDNTYKFVTVRYSDVKYSKKEDLFVINKDWYEDQKSLKSISNEAKFLFSMHHNELLKIIDENRNGIYRYVATKSDRTNTIEVKDIDSINQDRITPTIGRKVKLIKKYAADTLGNIIEIKDSSLKLAFK